MEKSVLEVSRGSERSFGVVFAVIFALIGVYLTWKNAGVAWWAFGVSALFLAIGLLRPAWLKTPNYLWFKFGMLLGAIVAPIVMGLVYLTTFLPLGFFMRVLGKDLLRVKLDKESDSYWIKREDPVQSMKNQF